MIGRATKNRMKREAVQRGERCRYCRVRLTDRNVTLDHLIPECLGGNHDAGNLGFCCERCNSLKGNQTAIEFREPPDTKPPKSKRATLLIPGWDVLDRQAASLGVTTPHLAQMILKRASKVIRRRVERGQS